jgi:predicted adenine nucleotide alpha hydrolase (AANH) superfamily ATPase
MPLRRCSLLSGRRDITRKNTYGKLPSGRRSGVGTVAFTTTLLYSRFQKHDLIRTVGEGVAVQQGIPFLYRDFREGWSEGVRISREIGMYRQPYCGCIYSERERFCRPSRKDDGRDASLGQGTRS